MAAHIRDGVVYEGSADGGKNNLEELNDVSLQNVQDGQALVYDAENSTWVNGDSVADEWVGTMAEYEALPDSKLTDGKTYFITDYPSETGSGSATTLRELKDVSLTDIQDKQSLVYDATNKRWVNGDSVSSLESLTDVDIQGAQDNQALVYDAENDKWVNGNTLSNLEELTDVDLIDVEDGQALVYDATNNKWVNGETISGDWVGTYEEYKALPDSKLTDGKTYFITDYPSDITISNIEADTIRVGDFTENNVFINKNEIIATETSGNMMGGGGTTYVSGTGVSVSKGSIMGMSTYGVDGIKINEVNGSYNNGLTTTMGLVLNGSSAKGIDSTPTKDSANLVTSGGVESSISTINSNLATKINGKVIGSTNIDANTISDEGVSVIWVNNGSNLPSGESSGILITTCSDVVGVQFFVNSSGGSNQKMFFRNKWGGGWRDWMKVTCTSA